MAVAELGKYFKLFREKPTSLVRERVDEVEASIQSESIRTACIRLIQKGVISHNGASVISPMGQVIADLPIIIKSERSTTEDSPIVLRDNNDDYYKRLYASELHLFHNRPGEIWHSSKEGLFFNRLASLSDLNHWRRKISQSESLIDKRK